MSAVNRRFGRRALLQGLVCGSAAVALTTASRRAMGSGRARRLIVFYFPDGIAGRSQDGMSSLWWANGAGSSLMLSELLQPLEARKNDCVFVRGLHMGATDEGSHPGGARKLLTNKDGGAGTSVDQHLANTVGRGSMHRHLYLGAQANVNNASGDKHISYPSAGVTVPPEDDPIRAFRRLFGAGTVGGGGAPAPVMGALDDDRSIIDTSLADLAELRARAGSSESVKLDLHLEALRELETRLRAMSTMMMGTPPPASCSMPTLSYAELTGSALYAPENFPAILRAQTDLMVTAMACGLTKVGVIQGSHHTSELIMSRFMGSEMFDAGFDMRSHQASHYGARQDRANRLFTDYVKQRRWWVSQFAYLLEQLRARPEGDGTMLDNSVVLLCSEVSDGNTHSHSDMPFVVAGRAGGCIAPGKVIEQNRRHGDLLASLATAMGESVTGWGDGSGDRLPGLLS
jgi:hypothetical protein